MSVVEMAKKDVDLMMTMISDFKEMTLNRLDLMRDDIKGIHQRQDIANGRTAKLELNLKSVQDTMVTKSDCQAKHLTKELSEAIDWKKKVSNFILKSWYIFLAAFIGFLLANINMGG